MTVINTNNAALKAQLASKTANRKLTESGQRLSSGFYISVIIKALWALAAHPNSPPAFCYDGLAKIIIKILLWICVFGVKFTNTVMGHR